MTRKDVFLHPNTNTQATYKYIYLIYKRLAHTLDYKKKFRKVSFRNPK